MNTERPLPKKETRVERKTLGKLSFLLFAAVITLSLTSCEKEYTCTCTTTLTANNTSSTTTINLGKQKKKDAEDACDARVTAVTGGTMTCALD